jgi:glycosyltransferase involved in cell wall biosynthesis
MRIAIICAHFLPEAGYQEVYVANACARLKHEVNVFTTTHIPKSHRLIIKNDYTLGTTKDSLNTYTINRLKSFPISGHLVVGFGLERAVNEYSPDILLIIGVGKIFPYPLLKTKYNTICFFGDNQDFYSTDSLKAKFVTFRQYLFKILFKNYLYRKAVINSKGIVCYTPQTALIISQSLFKKQRPLLDKKKIESTLGYDAAEFFFDEIERKNTREKLGLNEYDVLIVTATRINQNKEIEKIIDGINSLHLSGFPVHYLIIGFQADEYDQRIQAYIRKQHLPMNYHCFSFLEHKELRMFFCASDFGIWRKAAISIQESMGTGLNLFLENKGSINHLIEHGKNGWLYNRSTFNTELLLLVKSYVKMDETFKRERRLINCNTNKKYSYESVINDILLKSFDKQNQI